MLALPDIVPPEPLVLFCGRANRDPDDPQEREHYYETPGNNFWEMLQRSGLTPRRLRPEEDRLVVDHDLGLTDLLGGRRRLDVDIDDLVAKVEHWRPEWLAFTSKSTAQEAAGALGENGRPFRRVGLGATSWYVGGAPVFVLPGTSGANRRRDYDGRVDRLSWWRDLAALVGRGPDAGGPAGHAGPDASGG